MAVEVQLTIDSIVLEGMEPRDVPRFQTALARELQSRAESVQDWSTVRTPDPSRPLTVPYHRGPEDAATSIVDAIFGGRA